MKEQEIGLEEIVSVLRGNYWQEKLPLCYTVSVCRLRRGWPWQCLSKKRKKDRDLFGVLMLLIYFYTGVYGGDHDEPTAAYCAINSKWNATETLILCVYIGNDYKTVPALCWKKHFDVYVLTVVQFGLWLWWKQLCCYFWRRHVWEKILFF